MRSSLQGKDRRRETILLPLRVARGLHRRNRMGDRELLAISQATVAELKEEGIEPLAPEE